MVKVSSYDGGPRGRRILVPLGGCEYSLTEAEVTQLRDELGRELGASPRPEHAALIAAGRRLIAGLGAALGRQELSDLARVVAGYELALEEQPAGADLPAPTVRASTVRASTAIAPDVDSGQWYYRVALTLCRDGQRDMRLLSDIRGWTQAEAAAHAEQLATDIGRSGGLASRSPSDVARIAELEGRLRDAATPAPTRLLVQTEHRVAALESALRDLIARVEAVGGYASPEEQDVLHRAKAALAGAATPAPASPGAAFNPPGGGNSADQGPEG